MGSAARCAAKLALALLALQALEYVAAEQYDLGMTRFISKWRKDDLQQFAEFERGAARRAEILRRRGASARAGGAKAAGEFTLWIEATVPWDEAYPHCPTRAVNNELLVASLAARWPPGAAFAYSYQTQAGNMCYYLSTVVPDPSNSTMQADISAALAGSGVAGFCGLLGSYCTKMIEAGVTTFDSVQVNAKTMPWATIDSPLACEQLVFEQKLDHFDPSDARTFPQRYWVCNETWPTDPAKQVSSGVIIFDQGAEGQGRSPGGLIVYENAARLNALVIGIEHRYYGTSFPFGLTGDGQATTEQLEWLTVEQVLADSADLLAAIRAQLAVPAAVPAIAISGSYGGEVVSWLRASAPETWAAALASSPPINYVFGTQRWRRTGNDFYAVTTAATLAAADGGAACVTALRQGYDEILRLGRSAKGRAELTEGLGLCAGAVPDKQTAMSLSDAIYQTTIGVMQYDNAGRAYDVMRTICAKAVVPAAQASPTDKLAPLKRLLDYYTILEKNPAQGNCYKFSQETIKNPVFLVGNDSYTYQGCAQGAVNSGMMIRRPTKADVYFKFPRPTDGDLRRQCKGAFGKTVPPLKPAEVMRKSYQLLEQVGGVVFTNGELDAWSGGSPKSPADLDTKSNAAPGITYVTYPGTSHCSDLIWFDPLAPAGRKDLRTQAMDQAAEFAEAWRKSKA